MTDLNGNDLKARAEAAAEAAFITQGYIDEDGLVAKWKLADVLVGPISGCVADSLNARDQVSLTRDQLMGITFPGVAGRDQWDSQDDPELAQATYDVLDTDVWYACNPGPSGAVQLKLNGGNGGLVLVRRNARKGHAGDVYVTRNKQCLMADVVNPQNKARTRRAQHEADVIALLMGRVPEHAKAFDAQMTEGLNDAKSTAKAITKAKLVTIAAAESDGE